MRKIVWTQTAVQDLQHIFDYISLDSHVYARALVDDVFVSIERVKSFPKSGRIVPEFRNDDTREVFVGSYRVIYDIKASTLHILTIIHGARKL